MCIRALTWRWFVMSASFVPRHSRNAVQVREGSSLGLRVTVVILQLFVGIGGIFGGLEMIRHPLNPLGMTTKLIAGSPFDTFTWPGILLLVLHISEPHETVLEL